MSNGNGTARRGEGLITDEQMSARAAAADIWLTDRGTRGDGRLVGRITPAGERLFYFRYTKADGKRDTLLIGGYSRKALTGSFTLREAREKARQFSALINPINRATVPIPNRDLRAFLASQEDEKHRERINAELAAELARKEAQRAAHAAALRVVTFKQVFDQWRATALQPHVGADGRRIGRKDGGRYVAEQFSRHVFPTLETRAIASITKADVLFILDGLKAEGKLRTASVIFADMRQMFAFAVKREWIDVNPFDRLEKRVDAGGRDTERQRVLSEAELSELAERIEFANLNLRTGLAIWALLATGARVGELMGAAWSTHRTPAKQLADVADANGVKFGTVDMIKRQWYLPDTKNQRDHTIHLSDFALDCFRKLSELSEHPDWIFPDRTGGKPVCVKSFGKQIADRQRGDRAAMANRSSATNALTFPGGKWTAHDLRRTAATLMARMGVSSDVINECLNHKQADRMTRVYVTDRRQDEQKRAFEILGTKLTVFASYAANALEEFGLEKPKRAQQTAS